MLKNKKLKYIPKEEDFYDSHNLKNSCDTSYAIKKYLGRDLDYVLNLYGKKSSSMGLIDDLRYIRAKAFSYYILATFIYVKNENKSVDFDIFDTYDAISILPRTLEYKLDENPKEMKCIYEDIIDFSTWVIKNYDSFDEDYLIYDDVKEKYIKLIEKIGVLILPETT